MPLIIAAVSLAMLLVSGYLLASRVRDYNQRSVNHLYAYIEVVNPTFEFMGREIRVTDEHDEALGHIIRVRYGQDEITIPVSIEARRNIPGGVFNQNADWMRMLFCADRAGLTREEFEARMARDEIDTRLVIVTRTPFGLAPRKDGVFGLEQERNESTADVRRDQWRFDFYELLPDGGFEVQTSLRFPESGASLLRRQNNAKLKGEPIPQRDPGELQERTWQYGAALKVMPRPPAITFENQALRAAGWTLPVCSASVLGLMFGIFFAFAPARVRA